MIFEGFGSQRNPAFRHSRFHGDDKGGRRVGKFESQERKTIDLLHAHPRIEPFNDFCKRLVRKFRKSSSNFCKWNRAKRKRPPGIANLPIGAGAILCSLAPLREPGGCGLAVGFRLVWNGLSALKEKWERPSQGGASLCLGLTWAALSGLKSDTIPVPDSFSSFVVEKTFHGELFSFGLSSRCTRYWEPCAPRARVFARRKRGKPE